MQELACSPTTTLCNYVNGMGRIEERARCDNLLFQPLDSSKDTNSRLVQHLASICSAIMASHAGSERDPAIASTSSLHFLLWCISHSAEVIWPCTFDTLLAIFVQTELRHNDSSNCLMCNLASEVAQLSCGTTTPTFHFFARGIERKGGDREVYWKLLLNWLSVKVK